MSPARDLATYCASAERTTVSTLHVARIASDARVNAWLSYRIARDTYAVAHAATCDAWLSLTPGERMELIAEGYDGARRLNTF